MFYSQLILAKKGSLGKIWIAAHFEKKLTKAQIFSTDITNTVEALIHPSVPLAIRVSGHLMLGLVRIYSKKVKYLMIDCTDAMWKMQLAFRPAKVDMDPNQLNINIDDNRVFGNIIIDEDYPILENVAFAPPLVPFSRESVTLEYGRDEMVVDSFASSVSKRRKSSLTMEKAMFDIVPTPIGERVDEIDLFQMSNAAISPMIESIPVDLIEQMETASPYTVQPREPEIAPVEYPVEPNVLLEKPSFSVKDRRTAKRVKVREFRYT
jgi:hypothetical protein